MGQAGADVIGWLAGEASRAIAAVRTSAELSGSRFDISQHGSPTVRPVTALQCVAALAALSAGVRKGQGSNPGQGPRLADRLFAAQLAAAAKDLLQDTTADAGALFA